MSTFLSAQRNVPLPNSLKNPRAGSVQPSKAECTKLISQSIPALPSLHNLECHTWLKVISATKDLLTVQFIITYGLLNSFAYGFFALPAPSHTIGQQADESRRQGQLMSLKR